MAGTPGCLVLLFLICEAAAFTAQITRPSDCNENEVRFRREHQYLYHYSTAVETSFVGTTASKSAFKLDCEVVVEARRKCEAYMRVKLCSLFHRQPGEDDVYIKDTTLSSDVTRLLRREQLYFQFGRGKIRPHTIVVGNTETNEALNIKRGILSALQIQLAPEKPGDKIHTMITEDLFGSCPTEYKIESPDKVLTSRDITRCQVPHYSYNQNNLLSIIKRVYGGYLLSEIDELTYPFNSTIKCEHSIGDNNRLEETRCLQQQQFRPFAREEGTVSTCMTNISQHLILQETSNLANRNVNRKMKGKKSTGLMYEFDVDRDDIRVSKTDINQWLRRLTNYNDTNGIYPKVFHDFLWVLRQANTNELMEVMSDVWNCHGNHENYCNRKEQMLEQDYFLDGLLSCGTEACIGVFTNGMKAGHINKWLEFMFLYDLALSHAANPHIAMSLLGMCKERRSGNCWFPLSIMIRNIATTDESSVYLDSGVVYQTLDLIRETIGNTCVTGISENLDRDERQLLIDELLLMIKVLGNIGAPAQYVYDSKYTGMEGTTEDQRLVQALLQCAHNTELPHKVAKAAILALHKMNFTAEMSDALIHLLGGINRPPSFRTTVFARLVVQPDRNVITTLLDLVYTEKMDYLKNYMITHVNSLLENDQPDLEKLRSIWKEVIDADSRKFPYGSYAFGFTKYIEMSRYIKFPFRMEYFGFQIELDTVYNIASPIVNAIVLRISYFEGKKLDLLELAADIDNAHVIADALNILSLPNPLGNNEFMRGETVFATLQKNIVTTILELFDTINLSGTKVPDGLIQVKLLGEELFYLEFRDLLKFISHSRPRQSLQNTAMEQLHNMLQQLPVHRTSSASLLDMVKVLPTVAGFPMNMTVSATMSTGLDFDARLTMPDILSLNPDVQLDTSVKTRIAVQMNGELTTRLGQHSVSGARASFTGQGQVSLSPSLRFNTQPDPPRVLDVSLSHTNTDSKYTIADLSGHLYLTHQSGEMEVESDSEFQTTAQDCDEGIYSVVTGNQICITSVYPNTTSSSRHAYFPLSGPFTSSLDTRKVETDTINVAIARTKNGSNQHFWINVTRQGKSNIDGLILHHHSKDRLRFAKLILPAAQVHLYGKYGYSWSYSTFNNMNYVVYDLHMSVTGKSLFRFLVQVQDHRNLTNPRRSIISTRDIVDVTLAIPGASLAVTVNVFRNRSTGHINTACKVTYHCIKARPLLYLLHWNPILAAQNGEVTEAEMVFDVDYGFRNDHTLWRTNDYMMLSLSGLEISIDNKMEANLTNANRQTTIQYMGFTGEEYTMMMDAHVTNRTNITANIYDYFMMLSHSGMPYNLSFKGYLEGDSQDINLFAEIERVSKTDVSTLTFRENNLAEPEDVTTDGTEACNGKTGNTMLSLSVVSVPVPDGKEIRWNGSYNRQMCGGWTLYRTSGVYGRQNVNTITNFHYWATIDANVTTSRDAMDQQEAVTRSRSYGGDFQFRFKSYRWIDLVLDYNSDLVNTSNVLRLVDFSGRGLCFMIHQHLQTPLPAINFKFQNSGCWAGHVTQNSVMESAWLDITTESYYSFRFFSSNTTINISHYIDSRLPWLPGETNITIHYRTADTVLPLLLVNFERSEATVVVKAELINTTLAVVSVTLQKLEDEPIPVVTWEMALRSPRSLTHTVSWNADLFESLSLSHQDLRLTLLEIGEVALLNAHKPVIFMTIPFTDLTVGVLLGTYLYPYMYIHPGNGNPNSIPEITEPNGVNISGTKHPYTSGFGDLIVQKLSEYVGKNLRVIGGIDVRPPWIGERFIENILRPSVEKLMNESSVTFSTPLLGVYYALHKYPRQTYGALYLQGVYRRLTEGPRDTDRSVKAFVINRQYIKTYYGQIYHIQDDQAADCIHLLAADFSRERFALLLSRQGISVVTSEMSVMLEFGGDVYRDNCPRPVRLPLGRHGNRFHAFTYRNDIVLTTIHGVTVECNPHQDVCKISLSGGLYGHSWGLLGSNDGEPGSDLQLPNKFITKDTNEFISGYTVGGPPKCIRPGSDLQSRLEETIQPHQHVRSNIHLRCSKEMSDECIRQFTHAADYSACESYESQQLFLESCLAEAASCGRMPSDVCKHIRAYQYACHLNIIYDILDVNCSLGSSSQSGNNQRPIDIVLVVDESLGSSRPSIESHIETLLHVIRDNIRNVQLGIVGYGGDVHSSEFLNSTASTRYMVSLDTLDVSMRTSPWRQAWKRFQNIDTMDKALDMAASYPYRLTTLRVVMVISKKRKPYLSEDVKYKLKDFDIKVNSFGNYMSVNPSRKVNGINWDNTVIYRDWFSSYRTLPLPEDNLVELVVATKGAIFNAAPILKRRKKRLRFIVKHIKTQLRMNNVC
ncbi:uncharacterized protein [Argopecten irradians]|uniref:uncharacterized protein n=1 Tax=Argopecten irradians TaxID=31199 RepID=UPI003718D5B4